MATLFTTTFPNLYGELFTVHIDDSEYSGDPITIDTSDPGFNLAYDGDPKNPLQPIIGSRVSFPIRVDENTLSEVEAFGLDLIDSAEGRYTMAIYYNTGVPLASDSLYWTGYVLPDLSGFSDEFRFEFIITATDGLARLKGIDFWDDGDFYGWDTILNHVINCLTSDGLAALYYGPTDRFLITTVNWQDENIDGPDKDKDPVALTMIDATLLSKKVQGDVQQQPISCYDALEQIARLFACRIYYSFGSYRFEQVLERSQDFFYERRYNSSKTALSTTDVADADKTVDQGVNGARLSGGVFQYIPAARKVKVIYNHDTSRNYLSGQQVYWYKNSLFTSVTITPITVDADTFFRISGAVYMNISLDDDLVDVGPWRHIIGMSVFIAGESLNRDTSPVVGPSGPIPVVYEGPVSWISGAEKFEISSQFTADAQIIETVTFTVDTPVVPSGTSIYVSFESVGSFELDGSSPATTINDWRVNPIVFSIINNGDDSSFFERERHYTATNTSTGNSLVIEETQIFGHAIKGWTAGRMQTSDDGVTFLDTTASWEYDNNNNGLQFGDLWAYEVQAMYAKPRLVYSGQVHARQMYAHNRITLPDTTAFLFAGGEYTARLAVWRGDWIAAGTNRSDSLTGDTVLLGPNVGLPDTTEFNVILPGAVTTTTGGQTTTTGINLIFNQFATNYVGGTIPAGSVTSIPLELVSAGNTILAGDVLNIYNPATGQITTFTVTSDVGAGDTSISVSSVTTTEDINIGSYIFLANVNHTTTAGSGGGSALPAGTDTQTLRYNGTTLEANSALRNDGTYISINQAPDTSRMLIIKQGASTKGLAVVRDANTDQVHIYHNGTATVESVGGNSLALKTASGSLINLISGGGGGQLSQVQIAPGASMTANLGNAGMFVLFGTYAPTSSGGDFSLIRLGTAINQTGAADQPVAGLKIVPTLTAVATAFRGVWYEPSTQTFLWQPNGTGVGSHLIGNLGLGTGTTSPGAKLDIVGNGTTSGTYTAKFYDGNGTPAVIMVVRDDQRVGIRTASPSAPLHVVGTGISSAANGLLVEDSSNATTFQVRNDGVAIAGGYAAQSNAPSISFAGGAGTGPSNDFCVGSANGFYLIFTTGTSPGTNTSIFTATIGKSFPNGVIATFSPGNANILTPFPTLYISGTGGNSVTLSTTGTLAASTTYGIFFTIMGY